jgi:predicted enzyme related to lactoylglutathione lyase
MIHNFCHMELQTTDVDGAREFYSNMFGWKFESWQAPDDGGEYAMFNPGEGPGGGIMKLPHEGMPPMWVNYILVESVEEHLAKAIDLGAKELLGKTPVQDMGFFAVLTDPQGAPFCIWEEAKNN